MTTWTQTTRPSSVWTQASVGYILLEAPGYVLQEDGAKIVDEQSTPIATVWTPV